MSDHKQRQADDLKIKLVKADFIRIDGLPFRGVSDGEDRIISSEPYELGKFSTMNGLYTVVTPCGQVWTRSMSDGTPWLRFSISGIALDNRVRSWLWMNGEISPHHLDRRRADPDWEPPSEAAHAT